MDTAARVGEQHKNGPRMDFVRLLMLLVSKFFNGGFGLEEDA
jgi:hypothetical protein